MKPRPDFKSSLRPRQPRPTKLSDPHQDCSEQTLRILVSTPDSEMDWQHYKTLLGPHLPAGTYDEVVYFLPLAINRLWHHEEEALDLCSSIIWFASEYADEMERDGLLTAAREEMLALLQHWTRDFRVQHFDEHACKAKGWRLKHRDLVKMSEVVCQSMEDLDHFQRHADLITTFLHGLAAGIAQPANAGWLVELGRARRGDCYAPPSTPSVDAVLCNAELLQHAMFIAIKDAASRGQSMTYWDDVAMLLHLQCSTH